MKYDFKVKMEVFKLFVEDATDEKIIELQNEFKEFRISYNNKPIAKNNLSFIDLLEGNSDEQQIVMWGIDNKGYKYSIAYWLVGDGEFDEDTENYAEYKEALNAFKVMQMDYRIEE